METGRGRSLQQDIVTVETGRGRSLHQDIVTVETGRGRSLKQDIVAVETGRGRSLRQCASSRLDESDLGLNRSSRDLKLRLGGFDARPQIREPEIQTQLQSQDGRRSRAERSRVWLGPFDATLVPVPGLDSEADPGPGQIGAELDERGRGGGA
ncbi:hypothetical protein WMY93_004570 [Mugilogobius chulae]|uniref:Uncharacterized protein n=1 Tax=Mugilogobius chulae TaxID=88201 RepID=A0AAW0PRJ8_9GOBI